MRGRIRSPARKILNLSPQAWIAAEEAFRQGCGSSANFVVRSGYSARAPIKAMRNSLIPLVLALN